MLRPTVALIAAVARNGAIGKNNALLLHLPNDLPRLKRITLGHTVVMGRKTWESIGRPLPGRRNIVVSRNPRWSAPGTEAVLSIPAALALAAEAPKIFVLGGAEIYAQALPLADELILTEIDADLEGDAFFPVWDRSQFREVLREAGSTQGSLRFNYVTYARKAQA
jgi:dihydrofolate reductase